MKRIRAFIARVTSLSDPHTEWPFMLFLTFVFVFIYIWTVISSARVREPVILAAFTILFNIHLIFHWISIWWLNRGWNTWLYLGIQAAIVFTLVSIAGELGVMMGLYLGLIGEAVGLFYGSWPKKVLAVAGLLALSALNFYRVLPDGQILWWAIAILPMTVFVIIYVLLYSRQADARVKAQELLAELEAANKRLTESADKIEDLTLANERQRMARELHDTLAQGLAGLILQLEAADSHLGQGHPDRAQTIVQQSMTRARATLAESRRAIDGLRKEPAGSLEEALRMEADHFTSAFGVPCRLAISSPGPVSSEIQELIVRIVSESLANIARHAHARQASIALEENGGDLSLEVVDDGIGFNAEAGEGRKGHYGLVGLRERVRQAGGTLEIQSKQGEGTRVKAGIPIDPDKK
ncbi:MAG: sensor histidine kinase [Anaerolineales bacterium]|nr:sensor histidine kinase [Anaerolineales bacterium]